MYGDLPYQSVDVADDELIYHITDLNTPGVKYYIQWQWYQKERDKIKLQLRIDDSFTHNRWVYYDSLVDIGSWVPNACVQDGELVIKVKILNGPVAVVSGFQIKRQVVGGGGPQSIISIPGNLVFGLKVLPNIITRHTQLQYTIPEKQHITLKIYDIVGRNVGTIAEGIAEPGVYSYNFDSSNLSAGLYFLILEGEEETRIEKVMVVR